MLDQARLQELVAYDPETGAFAWRVAAGVQLAGRRAGSMKANHYQIIIEGKTYMAARVAWLYVHGVWPTALLRFNDGDSTNVRIANLRQSVPNSERLKDAEARREYKASLRGAEITQSEARELLDYNPILGTFVWRVSGSGRKQGAEAGNVSEDHRVIRIQGRDYQAQRLAWLYVHGELPPEGRRIRFENGNSLDYRIDNLRLGLSQQEHNARFRERHPESNREANYKKNYQGMTIPAFEAMSAAQGDVCAICKKPETTIDNTGTGKVRFLSVDHDHDTNSVRELLCSSCNRGLGLFGDSIDLLLAAAAYLERHATKKVAA